METREITKRIALTREFFEFICHYSRCLSNLVFLHVTKTCAKNNKRHDHSPHHRSYPLTVQMMTQCPTTPSNIPKHNCYLSKPMFQNKHQQASTFFSRNYQRWSWKIDRSCFLWCFLIRKHSQNFCRWHDHYSREKLSPVFLVPRV